MAIRMRHHERPTGDLITPSIKYADEKDRKKVDGVFSWLKDMLRPETPNITIRSIISCTRRNTNPPIREPNMPEKQQKKEDKKEKKKKKPVIRMEDSLSEICRKETSAEAKNNLHDNLDINFRYPKGFRLPEEGENAEKVWNGSIQQLESLQSINDTNYSSYDSTSTYNIDSIQAMKNLQLSMSSEKDSEKDLAKPTVPKQELLKAVESEKESETGNLEGPTKSTQEVMKSATNEKKDSNPDEDYNVPSVTAFDTEISAWKDLVLKSKIPIDPSKEEFLERENSGSTRRVDMLSIRPEAPQPKLDVQAVPTSDDELMKDEEEEPDASKDLKGNLKATDVKVTGGIADVQKANSKKLHTEPFYSSRKVSVNKFQGRLKLHDSSRILEFVDNDVSFVTMNYSTSPRGGWERVEPSVSKDKDIVKEEMLNEEELKRQDLQENTIENMGGLERNETGLNRGQESVINFKREDQDVDRSFVDGTNLISDDEIDNTMNRKVNRDSRESFRMSSKDSKQFESDERVSPRFQEIQDNYDYANSLYEDDFYPGYETMGLEPTKEMPKSSQLEDHKSQPPIIARDKDNPIFENSEMYDRSEEISDRGDYVIDGSYIKWPGDPYPYSREHFHKWKRHHTSDMHLADSSHVVNDLHETILNTPTPGSSSEKSVEVQPPARKMSIYARLRGSLGGNVCK